MHIICSSNRSRLAPPTFLSSFFLLRRGNSWRMRSKMSWVVSPIALGRKGKENKEERRRKKFSGTERTNQKPIASRRIGSCHTTFSWDLSLSPFHMASPVVMVTSSLALGLPSVDYGPEAARKRSNTSNVLCFLLSLLPRFRLNQGKPRNRRKF